MPVPWPWTVNFAAIPFGESVRGVLVGLFFMGLLAFGGLAVLWVVLQKFRGKPVPPALVAAAFLALPYAHFAFSRARVAHLAQGIFPFLVGCLVLLSNKEARIKWPLALGLCVASLWVMHVFHPGWQCRASKHCQNVEIAGRNLLVDSRTASDIALLRRLATKYTPNGQAFLVAPFWPGAYPLLERKSPMWSAYPIWPRTINVQQKEIDRIQATKLGFALIIDLPLDGREELRFKNTNPLIYRYIVDNFDRVSDSPNPAYQIYKAKEDAQ